MLKKIVLVATLFIQSSLYGSSMFQISAIRSVAVGKSPERGVFLRIAAFVTAEQQLKTFHIYEQPNAGQPFNWCVKAAALASSQQKLMKLSYAADDLGSSSTETNAVAVECSYLP